MEREYQIVCQQLKDAARKACPNGENDLMKCYYRGQCNKDWSLQPSIARSYYNCAEYDQIKKAKNSNQWIATDSLFENIARMQHYGYPTRFLDFSTDIDVALYFACSSPDSNDDEATDGAIYVTSYSSDRDFKTLDSALIAELSSLTSKISLCKFAEKFMVLHSDEVKKGNLHKYLDDKTSLELEILSWIEHGFMVTPTDDDYKKIQGANPRVVRQRGAFFVFGNKITPPNTEAFTWNLDKVEILPEIAEAPTTILPNSESTYSSKIIIKAEWKESILQSLSEKGITGEYLFPDEQ